MKDQLFFPPLESLCSEYVLVGGTGLEPVTPSMSRKCATRLRQPPVGYQILPLPAFRLILVGDHISKPAQELGIWKNKVEARLPVEISLNLLDEYFYGRTCVF